MAEGDGRLYGAFLSNVLKKVINLDVSQDALRAILMSTFTPNYDTNDVYATISGNEISGSGYAATGDGLANTSNVVAVVSASDWVKFDVEDASWAALATATPTYAVPYDDTPTSPADPLIGTIVLGTTAPNGGQYNIVFNSAGLLYITY